MRRASLLPRAQRLIQNCAIVHTRLSTARSDSGCYPKQSLVCDATIVKLRRLIASQGGDVFAIAPLIDLDGGLFWALS